MIKSPYNTAEQNREQFSIHKHVKDTVLPKLKEQRKTVKGEKYLYCCGQHGYNWAAYYSNEKKTYNRVCQVFSLVDIIEDSMDEYTKITKSSIDTISFKFISREELDAIYPNLGKHVASINVPGKFWKDYNLN